MSQGKQKRSLEPEQAAAAHTLDRHISVTAGPGSGKTTVLVERYLHILRTFKPSIDEIVAITFTNRAANEMRERLRRELDQILQSVPSDERPRWLNYKRTLDGAIITTIHGFCARLLREFPVEARIDPQFTLLDEHRAAMLLEAAAEEALTEFINAGHTEISRLTLGIGRGRLAAALVQLHKQIRGQGLSFAELQRQTKATHSAREAYEESLAELDQHMNEYIGLRRLTPAAEKKRGFAVGQWPTVRALLHAEELSLADYCSSIEELRASGRAQKNAAAVVSKLDELLWGEDKTALGRVPQICFDLFARDYAIEVIELIRRVDERLTAEKQRLSALDFDDLQVRALALLEREEVLARAAQRYHFYLVDEFQDTNSMQRDLMTRLALGSQRARANLFIVGDRKQSIYGFRGADVDVFRETTAALVKQGGREQPLLLNFRSQPPLINLFNLLFSNLFQHGTDLRSEELEKLGYVAHEPSVAKRELRDEGPLVELLIDTKPSDEHDAKRELTPADRDARQVALRIAALTAGADAGSAGILPAVGQRSDEIEQSARDESELRDGRQDACAPSVKAPSANYRDIALLFRAMTHVQAYESVLRRTNIPYQTILGKGFYEREEISDLIQLLRFLDNKTDELALAAVLRSPLCGISDNSLLALRCAPKVSETTDGDNLRKFSRGRKLFRALRDHHEIAFISEDEHRLLERAAQLINGLIERRNHYPLADLLRFAVEQSEYTTVVAANFDGAQRLTNAQRLFTLAERFEHSGAHFIRDFVQYVEEFEAIGSRESEGQIDASANVVRLMTIHQAKGLEFPIVILPDLHRWPRAGDDWYLLDRHRGLTLKVPDGRGKQVAGDTFTAFQERDKLRERFESMRLLYVAATRAEDRLILSGAVDDLSGLATGADNWLKWICQSLSLENQRETGIVDLADGVQIDFQINLADQADGHRQQRDNAAPFAEIEPDAAKAETFPLLRPIAPQDDHVVHRYSVTQLLNYQRCPRQYYFDRVLHVPSAEAAAVGNDAEAPEPPANLTATLKGAVIHRFCETFRDGDELDERLRQSFRDVIRARQAELADRLAEIDEAKAISELLPLAQNYLHSAVFTRVAAAQEPATNAIVNSVSPGRDAGLWSELSFRLRRPLGILTGAIDKLLITKTSDGLEVEIIDFKTNRFAVRPAIERFAVSPVPAPETNRSLRQVKSRDDRPEKQFAFDFAGLDQKANADVILGPRGENSSTIADDVARVASDYQLQMQAYALAASELLPTATQLRIKVLLHFLDPNVEYELPPELLEPAVCAQAIDAAMSEMASATEPAQFPVRPATHCRMCSFLDLCAAGRDSLRRGGA